MLMQRGFDNQLKLWTGGVEMVVYVEHGAKPEQVQLIQQELARQTSVVQKVDYCDETCATGVANTLFAGDLAKIGATETPAPKKKKAATSNSASASANSTA